MKTILYIIMCFPLLTMAQANNNKSEVDWEKITDWQRLLLKAKATDKLVFVYCGLSKGEQSSKMETEVFSNEKVMELLSRKFIATKLETDSLREEIKDLILSKESTEFKKRFAITDYPTLLFFSPDGKILHRANGYKEVNDFITVAAYAANPSKQYYTLLDAYQQGRKDFSVMPYLANTAREVKDRDWANTIARDYISNYLMKLGEADLYTQQNLGFISRFVGSKDGGFHLFYQEAEKVDRIMGEGFSERTVDYVIAKEEIDPKLWRDLNPDKPFTANPDWNKMTAEIVKRFGYSYAERTVLNAKLRWYNSRKEWNEYCNAVVEKVERYGPYGLFDDKTWQLNWNAWDIFLHGTEKDVLTKALEWSEKVVRMEPKHAGYLDTYANLLYKLGRTNEAITLETKAVSIDPKATDIHDTLEKMRRREPTWPIE